MRKFSSYGQIQTSQHYYAPRTALIEHAYTQLLGETPDEGGHYITVWAPRQTGKSSVMLEAVKKLMDLEQFEVAIITLESAKEHTNEQTVLKMFIKELSLFLGRELPTIRVWDDFAELFTQEYFPKPFILILDEFDALDNRFINKFASEFRKIYTSRLSEVKKTTADKTYRLHGLASIGVRSVLGIENVSGSPFNVQRSLHIPNLTFEEVEGLFQWYQRESGQQVEQAVIERIYDETLGQPGLTCWLGELLTEGVEDYQPPRDRPLTMDDFNYVFLWATRGLPNANILNIISKAKQEPYKDAVLNLFKTEEKQPFDYDDPCLNFLYMNGVIAIERTPNEFYVKFASPFVQKRLFNYFSKDLFRYMGKLHEPFEDMSDVYTEEGLNVRGLAMRFQSHLRKNRDWLLKDAPRRKDLRFFEAVFHFSFYRFLCDFLGTKYAQVYPEFPTGNGQIDLIIVYRGVRYGVELKSFTNKTEYDEALVQAARYGKHLNLTEITLISFVDSVNEEIRMRYEKTHTDRETGVHVLPVLVDIGS
ncbi:MAG: hypothetical protein GY801_20980 [bacterium]|nr:hypothetical protein [bacterium]